MATRRSPTIFQRPRSNPPELGRTATEQSRHSPRRSARKSAPVYCLLPTISSVFPDAAVSPLLHFTANYGHDQTFHSFRPAGIGVANPIRRHV